MGERFDRNAVDGRNHGRARGRIQIEIRLIPGLRRGTLKFRR
jgi:hypothetical protein